MPAKIDDADLHGCESSDLIQGTLEMLILKTLALEPMHGYGVVLRIEQISVGVFRVNAGSLLPALSRMERAGRVKPSGEPLKIIAARNTTYSPQKAERLSHRKLSNGTVRSRPSPESSKRNPARQAKHPGAEL